MGSGCWVEVDELVCGFGGSNSNSKLRPVHEGGHSNWRSSRPTQKDETLRGRAISFDPSINCHLQLLLYPGCNRNGVGASLASPRQHQNLHPCDGLGVGRFRGRDVLGVGDVTPRGRGRGRGRLHDWGHDHDHALARATAARTRPLLVFTLIWIPEPVLVPVPIYGYWY